MGRPRQYDRTVVVEAAKELFWRRGYQDTPLDEIEVATGLGRSSIYQAFGSKRALFDEALDRYDRTFLDPMLRPLEGPRAGPADAVAFFSALADRFRGEHGSRGCLMVNTIGELAGRDSAVTLDGAVLHLRYVAAFANALGTFCGPGPEGDVEHRPRLLAALALGLWLVARVDPVAAATTCDAVSAQIARWTRS